MINLSETVLDVPAVGLVDIGGRSEPINVARLSFHIAAGEVSLVAEENARTTFVFLGLLTGTTVSGLPFERELVGHGTTWAQLTAFGPPSDPNSSLRLDTRYDFAPAPVPEPATLVLLGTGLCGIALRRRKRAQAKAQGA